MEALLHQIFSGLANGCIYGSVALALVMIYQATHHINFAQGEMATFSTFVAWALIQAGWPYWGAFFFTIAVSFAGGLLVQRIVLRPLEKAPVLTNVIVFIGLLLIFNALSGWIFDHTIKAFASPFPKDSGLATRFFSAHQLGSAAVLLAVLLGPVRLLPLHADRPGDARRGAKPRFGAPRRNPRLVDARARLGPGGGDRRGGRNDGRARRLP